MSKSIKLKNDTYIDSSSIVYNKQKLSDILNIQTINLNFNSDYIYDTDLDYKCVKIGKLVILNICTLSFKQAVPNYQVFISGLPKTANEYIIFYFYGGATAMGKSCRCALTPNGDIQTHWGSPGEYGDSANKQYGCTLIYLTNE